MYVAKYLLSIEELIQICSDPTTKDRQPYLSALGGLENSGGLENMNVEKGEALLERAFFCVDETRRSKAERMRPGRARAACLGAGLLLQLAVGEALEKEGNAGEGEEKGGFKLYSVSQLLAHVEETPHFSLSYHYGEKGKPYFTDLPYYFNLSHSGDYVLCGFSDVEIGADIQQHCGKNVEKLAVRFFSEREADVLAQAGEEREKLFYRLWARKEAYGKLTGKGVAEFLGVDMLPGNGRTPESGRGFESRYVLPVRMPLDIISQPMSMPDGRELIWDEYDGIEGYSIAFCIENGDRCREIYQ